MKNKLDETKMNLIFLRQKQFTDYDDILDIVFHEWWDYIPENWVDWTDEEMNEFFYNLLWGDHEIL